MPPKQLEHVAIPEIPFHELVLATAWQHHCEDPTKKAFIAAEDPDDFVTFGDVHRITHSIAGFLKDIGFTKGDVCLVSLPNCWQFATIFLAVGANGGATTGISEDSTRYETQRQLDDSTASVVFTNSYCLPKFVKATDKCKKLKAVVLLDKLRGPAPATTFRLYRWKDAVAREPSFDRRSVTIDPRNDVLGLPYSSGTTGQPKGVMLTHYNYTAQMTLSKAHFERHIMPFGGYDPKESKYTVHFLPLYHVYGFFSLNASLLFGSTVVIIRRYTPQLLLSCIEKYKVARVSMVPGLLAFLAKSPMVDKYDLSSMKQVGNGGGPLSRELAEAVLKRLPHLKHVAQGYGMTEMTTGMHASVLSEGNVALGSVGRIYPNCEQKIIDPDTGKECGVGEEGELYVRGPNVMKGYWRNENATREVLSPDGWLRTGDIVVEDERGLLYIRDRNKELIKVNAFQVAPTELEALLMTHHGVLDAAVIGIPHPSKGEVPRAYVVRRSENLTEKQIVDFVADRVSHYRRLAGGVEFIREIPRNPTGKVLRRLLKEEFLKRSENGNGRAKL